MNKAIYFPMHTAHYTAVKSLKIRSKYKLEGYSIYVMLWQKLAEADDRRLSMDDDDLLALADDFRCEKTTLEKIINDYLSVEAGYFYSPELNASLGYFDAKKEKAANGGKKAAENLTPEQRIERGKKAAEKRWSNKDDAKQEQISDANEQALDANNININRNGDGNGDRNGNRNGNKIEIEMETPSASVLADDLSSQPQSDNLADEPQETVMSSSPQKEAEAVVELKSIQIPISNPISTPETQKVLLKSESLLCHDPDDGTDLGLPPFEYPHKVLNVDLKSHPQEKDLKDNPKSQPQEKDKTIITTSQEKEVEFTRDFQAVEMEIRQYEPQLFNPGNKEYLVANYIKYLKAYPKTRITLSKYEDILYCYFVYSVEDDEGVNHYVTAHNPVITPSTIQTIIDAIHKDEIIRNNFIETIKYYKSI